MDQKNHKISGQATETRENSVGWMFNMLGQSTNKVMKKKLAALGLTQSQFTILMTLFESDGISQTEIGKRVMMPGYATTRNIDGLEERGLLKRAADSHSRRSYSILVTEDGWDLAPKLFTVVAEVNASLLDCLRKDEIDQLTKLLNKLVKTAA